ncbi:hypothetical protein ACTMU2_12440 [Cupriavidus basilensis]
MKCASVLKPLCGGAMPVRQPRHAAGSRSPATRSWWRARPRRSCHCGRASPAADFPGTDITLVIDPRVYGSNPVSNLINPRAGAP